MHAKFQRNFPAVASTSPGVLEILSRRVLNGPNIWSVLREIGIPVPRGRAASDAEDACVAAQQAGWPVVVKPQDAIPQLGEMVVVHLTLEDVLQEGLPFERCDELIECPSGSPTPDSHDDACPEYLRQAADCIRASLTVRSPSLQIRP